MNPPTRDLLTRLARFAEYGTGTAEAAITVAVMAYESGYKDGRDMEAKTATVPPGTALSAMLSAMRGGRKIEAIKHLRSATGWGLKESKEFCEQLADLARIGGF